MKIEEFERLRRQAQLEKQKISASIEDLLRQEAELNNAATAAAESGDVDGYLSKSKEKDRVTATIFVKRRQLDKLAPFTDEDVVDSWREYAVQYNKAIDKKIADYERQRKALREAYLDLCKTQNSALIERARYGEFVTDAGALNCVDITLLDNSNSIRVFGGNMIAETADMRFCRAGCASLEEDQDMTAFFNSVVRQRVPYTK